MSIIAQRQRPPSYCEGRNSRLASDPILRNVRFSGSIRGSVHSESTTLGQVVLAVRLEPNVVSCLCGKIRALPSAVTSSIAHILEAAFRIVHDASCGVTQPPSDALLQELDSHVLLAKCGGLGEIPVHLDGYETAMCGL
jgi:hypothetical protein